MFTAKPDFNRLIATLEHREPDRVPLVEAIISWKIMSQFLGRPVDDDDLPAQVEFWSRAGYDFIPISVSMLNPGGVTKDSHIAKVISRVMLDAEEEAAEGWNLEKRSWIHDERDFERFPWDEASTLGFDKFYEVQQYLPDGMKIVALSGKIFTLSWMLMGFENFCANIHLKPNLVAALVERVAKIQFDAVTHIEKIPNVAAVWAVDDIAFGTGPILSPKTFRQHVFPWYKEMARRCHDAGLYFFFHSDGVLWDMMDDLLDIGIDALHPIDPTCVDINEAKARIGDRVTLFGNISNELLQIGTPEEVAALTRKRLREVAPGGGYALGSGNSVPDWAEFDKYMAMRNTVLEYGHYPIRA